jgi:hypothetical protein
MATNFGPQQLCLLMEYLGMGKAALTTSCSASRIQTSTMSVLGHTTCSMMMEGNTTVQRQIIYAV